MKALRGRSVLFLLNSLEVGGSERKTIRLANGLAARGHRVTLAYLNGPETLLAELNDAIESVNLRRSGKFSPGPVRRLADLIGRNDVDTLLCVNLYPALYAGLLTWSRRFAHVRFIASINTTDFSSVGSGRRMLLYRTFLRRMDLLLFGAKYQRDLWLREHLGSHAPESRVLYNGVDAEHFRKEAVKAWRPAGWPPGRIVVGAVSRLRPEKSLDQLIRAIGELHRRGFDVGAVIVGDGDQEPVLRRMIAQLQLEDRICLPGLAQDVRPYLAGFDVLVITSTSVETFSNAALEAFAMSCPVVSSRVGGMPEMLAFGGGATYEIGNVAGLVEELQSLVVSDHRRAMLAKQARDAVIEHFSIDAMIGSFRALTSM
jgi:L-malate glycosyltransferase